MSTSSTPESAADSGPRWGSDGFPEAAGGPLVAGACAAVAAAVGGVGPGTEDGSEGVISLSVAGVAEAAGAFTWRPFANSSGGGTTPILRSSSRVSSSLEDSMAGGKLTEKDSTSSSELP